jgi:hypothetical protein
MRESIINQDTLGAVSRMSVLAFKFGSFGYYYLDGEKVILISMSGDIRIPAYDKTRGD